MGNFLKQSNDIVDSSSQLLDDILSSKFNQFLQGLGQPILVTYWNLNDTESTANNGTETIDESVGPNSPIKFNKIENFPLYGAVRELIPELTIDDNLLDLDINIEAVILPDTIKPSDHDYFEYRFGSNNSRSIVFKINNLNLTTIRSNSYYKIECNLVDIDDHNRYSSRISNQVVKQFETNLETIGTNDKCIIESKQLGILKQIDKIINDLVHQYIDMYYSNRYNSIVYEGFFHEKYLGYDPWVTEFIILNNLFTNVKIKNPIMLVNFDQGSNFRKKYNMTFFHSVEIKSTKYLKDLRYIPQSFSKINTNPFTYYGEEIAFKIDIFEDEPTIYSPNTYMDIPFKSNIFLNEKCDSLNEMEQLFIDYFNHTDVSDILSNDMIQKLDNFVIEYSEYWFRFTPVLIYILNAIYIDINNRYS